MPRLEPATVSFAADGTPASERYGDVYHSADSGPGQARHVFLRGNGLPERWRGRESFVVLETGFGLGLNFLATWDAWRRDPSRPGRLDYVAIEKHPFARDDLATLLARYPEFRDLADDLVDRWPALLPGTHRRTFDGRVALTLVFDDIDAALRRLDVAADAVYLDGFAPSRNPAMWSPVALRGVARRMRPDACCATWSTARAVRDALSAAGVDVDIQPGFGSKREMLVGRRARHATPNADPVDRRGASHERHAIVVGAGLAGTSAAASLAARGWRITLVDAASGPGAGASSLHAGSFHPLVARDDSLLARMSRAAFLHALDAWRELERRGHAIAWASCGVLQLARRHDGEAALREAIETSGFPPSFVRHVDADTGSALAGMGVDRPGAWFPGGGWARAPSIVRALADDAMSASGTRFLASTRVDRLERGPDGWRILAADGSVIAAAPTIVLANASDLPRLALLGTPVRSVRGQVTYLPASALVPPRAIVIGQGYVLPDIDGLVVVGSSYDVESDESAPTLASHEGNLARLRALSPGLDVDAVASALEGGVGFRAVVADRMPVVGAMPDLAHDAGAGREATREGLYAIGALASRGITWSALAGEFLASCIAGEPLPIETDLAAAIDPVRFLRRARRRAGR